MSEKSRRSSLLLTCGNTQFVLQEHLSIHYTSHISKYWRMMDEPQMSKTMAMCIKADQTNEPSKSIMHTCSKPFWGMWKGKLMMNCLICVFAVC